MLDRIIKALEHLKTVPVEIPDVRNAIMKLGEINHIDLMPWPIPEGKLRGMIYQYEARPKVYAEPALMSLIVFCDKLSLPWQRLICCKELIHVLDGAARTKTRDGVRHLVERLLGQLSTETFGIADLAAAKDRIAIYQALAVLFPDSERKKALEMLDKGIADPVKIAAALSLPLELVLMVLDETWPSIREDLIHC